MDSLTPDGRNERTIVCRLCNSLILRPRSAVYHEETVSQGLVSSQRHWKVDDIFQFENIGSSKPGEDGVYLACAECDVIVGVTLRNTHLVSVASVSYN